ncbi:hypothetical protein AALF16_14165 [Bacillus cereus]|uniref:hypothetical protein n=1 Tax=Bacillus cereus TaxID=1396 RepID=UPI00356FB9B5
MLKTKQKKRNYREPEELKTEPGPLVKSVVIQNNKSDDFEEARTEWAPLDYITSESADFVDRCQLCNHVNHVGNWKIQNVNTQITLKVGSDCIKRFLTLYGTKDQQDTIRYLQNKENEIKQEQQLITLYKPVIIDVLPLARDSNKFHRTLITLLESRGQKHLIQTPEGITTILQSIFRKPTPSDKEINTLFSALNSPSDFAIQRETKKFKAYIAKEGSTWTRKGKVTASTLTGSESYKNPYEKY